MSLTERIVDLDFIIKEFAVIIETFGQPCKDAIVMSIAPNQIVLTITIYIADQYRAGQTLGPTWVILPWTSIGIAFWSFIPTSTDYDIASPIVV